MRSGDPTLIALLIAALTYIREVVCRRRSTRERHACVESDSAERKEKRAPRLERTATIFPFDLRGARTSAAGTHGARCTHTCSTPLLRGIKRSWISADAYLLVGYPPRSSSHRFPLVSIGLRASPYEARNNTGVLLPSSPRTYERTKRDAV